MICTRIDLELVHLGTAQGVLGKHSADCFFHRTNGVLLQKIRIAGGSKSARETRVAVGHLLSQLGPREGNLLRVHNDDVVAHVHVGGKGRLVLAAQKSGCVGRKASQHHISGVDNQPVALNISRLG